jgi:class 3 adenylate cyclase
VYSTGIAARLDAEEWCDLVNAYLDDASAAVIEMGGNVAKKLGDGRMALFGYPLRRHARRHARGPDEMRADAMRWLVVEYSVLKEGAVASQLP